MDALKGMFSWTKVHPVFDDNINLKIGLGSWPKAAFLPTFLAVEKSLVDVSRKAILKGKTNLEYVS